MDRVLPSHFEHRGLLIDYIIAPYKVVELPMWLGHEKLLAFEAVGLNLGHNIA